MQWHSAARTSITTATTTTASPKQAKPRVASALAPTLTNWRLGALGPVVWSGGRRRSRRRLWTLEVLILSSSFLQLHSSASTLGQPFPRLPSQARRCGFSLCLSRHAHPRHLCFRSQPVRFKLISNSFISVFCSLFGFRITSLRDPFISETIPFFIPL